MDIQNISAEQLDAMFGGEVIAAPETSQNLQGAQNLPEINLDELEDSKEEKDPDPEKEETKKEETEKEESKEEDTEIDVSPILKNTVQYLISQGIWEDFEGREDMEIDEKVYAELVQKQNEHKVNQMFSELVDSTGDYGKAIIQHIKDGGNPDVIIDLFKEQKEMEQIDTSSEEGKITKIGIYYSDVLGWKPERIKKHIQRILADEDLETEFSDIEEQYSSYYERKLQEINRSREDDLKKRKDDQRRFVESVNSSMMDLGYNDSERKFIENSLFTIIKDSQGNQTTKFRERYNEVSRDPKKLIKLVEFIMDDKKFIEKIKAAEETKAATKTFSFIKGNSATSKPKGSEKPDLTDKSNNLDFSLLLNKR